MWTVGRDQGSDGHAEAPTLQVLCLRQTRGKNIISEQKSRAMHEINIMNDTANSSCGQNQGL